MSSRRRGCREIGRQVFRVQSICECIYDVSARDESGSKHDNADASAFFRNRSSTAAIDWGTGPVVQVDFEWISISSSGTCLDLQF